MKMTAQFSDRNAIDSVLCCVLFSSPILRLVLLIFSPNWVGNIFYRKKEFFLTQKRYFCHNVEILFTHFIQRRER